jgi:oligopeptide/dipeptide ABC transporter ATP-binding protein
MIIVTHDISIIAEMCNRTAVMYAGKIAEIGTVVSVLKRPSHPYTMGLKNAFPSIKGERKELIFIPGSPSKLVHPPPGCRFFERCPFSIDLCREEEPRIKQVDADQFAACHRVEEADKLRYLSAFKDTWEELPREA